MMPLWGWGMMVQRSTFKAAAPRPREQRGMAGTGVGRKVSVPGALSTNAGLALGLCFALSQTRSAGNVFP